MKLKKSTSRAFPIVFLSLLFISFFSFKLHAEFFVIDQYAIDVTISEKGYFDVVETIRVNFSEERRGIIRSIPTRETYQGKTMKVDISNILVDGWKFKNYKEGKYQKIRIGDADIFVNGRQEYKIRYRVKNAFLFFDDFTEFHWNLIGTEWDVPIEKVNYSIQLPNATDILNFAAFSGNKNESENKISIQQSGDKLIGSSRERLQVGEGLTVAIQLPVDAIDRTNATDTKTGERNGFSDFFFPIPAALAALMIGFWRRFGRNKKIKNLPENVFYPPDDIAAAELGVMVDDQANDRDVLSLIPEWGRLGYIRLRSTGEEVGEIKSDMFIEKLKDLPSNVPGYQSVLFQALFNDRSIVLLSSLKDTFYNEFSKAKSALKKEVRYSNFYDAESYKLFHKGWFILIGILCLIAGILVIALMGKIVTGIILITLMIPAFIIHFSKPKKSESGIQFLVKLKAFKKFLETSPERQVNSILEDDPGYFEKMLPYAVAFGLDKIWMSRFETFNQEVPGWYYFGHNTGNAHRASMAQFQNGFSIDTVQSVFISSPPPAGGSGSGGFSGGSTGGGFGGGGGSSW